MSDDIRIGERREVTVLFADMKGFTSLSEKLDPEELDSLMTRIFAAFGEAIQALGGTVEKYIGDAIVAVFGVPEVHEDDPSRALHAAFDMLSRAKGIAAELAGRGVEVSFRIGVHTGLITTGRRGDHEVVTGHAMSVAQRLEAAAPPDGILASEATMNACASEFEFAEPFELVAKGKVEPIAAYRVLGLSSGTRIDAGPFVGRRDALDAMLKDYIKNRYDEVSGYFLSGDVGIGKTRLALALIEKIGRFPDFGTPILTARAMKFRPQRFAVPLDILRDYLSLDAERDAAVAEAAALERLGVTMEAAKVFGRLVSDRDALRVDPDAIASLYALFEAVLRKHAADLFPILVFIDDADRMDRMSVDFFAYFLKNCPIKPFFVVAARELPVAVRKAFKGLKNLRLEPLKAEESRELVRAWWPDAPSGELVERVLESSLGNPLFLREYVSYASKHKDASSLPATIQNIFLASLDRYGKESAEFLKRLSVVRASFDLDLAHAVQRASGAPESVVEESLGEFERDGIVARSGETWSFRLDVFKQALYESLLNHNKRVLHGVVADRMRERGKPNLPRLVHHLVRAERWDEAARAIEADPHARYNYDYHEDLDALLKRIGKVDRGAGARLLITKSAQLFNMGRYEESEQSLKQIIKIALAKRDAECMGYAYHQVAVYNSIANAYQKALLAAQKALHYYKRSGAQAASVQHVLETLALIEARRNNFDDGRRYLEACAHYKDGSAYRVADAEAEFRLLSGDYEKSLAVIDRAIAALGAEDDVSRFFALDIRVRALWQLCDYPELVRSARELLELRPLSEPVLAQTHAMLAAAALATGDLSGSRDAFLQAGFFADQIRNDYDRVEALRALAVSRAMAGESKEAEAIARDALVPGLRHTCYGASFSLLTLLCELAIAREGRDEAAFFLEEAGFCLSSGLWVDRKDLALYFRFSSILFEEGRESSARVAASILEEERLRLGSAGRFEAMLRSRAYSGPAPLP
jgi:class 3 adenylate cyclase/tetratricopeptide (TPR) repeat protein